MRALGAEASLPAPLDSGWIFGLGRASGEGMVLPRPLAGRAFGPAWTIALALHAALLAWVLFAPVAAPPVEEPLVRLVFREPPPPPLGVPQGAPVANVMPAPEPKPEPLRQVPVVPKPVEPRRLRRVDTARRPTPKPEAREVPPSLPDAAPVVAQGVPAGQAGGVPGGVAGGTGTEAVPVAHVAHPPVLVRRVAPVYPSEARRREIEGRVLLQAVLDRRGQVEPGVTVLESVPMLDDEAIAAVRKWRFQPARNDRGEPLRVILEIPLRFVLR